MTGFVVGLVLSIMAVTGLVVDGSRLLATRVELDDHAANAARLAAQYIVDVRTGSERIDEEAGPRAALNYLASHGLGGNVAVAGLSVRVTTGRHVRMSLLSLVGVDDRFISVVRVVDVVDQ